MSIAARLKRTWTALIGAAPELASTPDDEWMSTNVPFLDSWPPGHFYSIVPSADDVVRAKRRRDGAGPSVAGIALAPGDLVPHFLERAELVRDWDGGADMTGRYHGGNGAFDIGDAAMLRATLLLIRPDRVVEVGSGWSSACMLDTIEEAGLDTSVTFIEPYPATLLARLRPADHGRVEIHEVPVQDVPTGLFESLRSGDVLFIDSSHVFKPGSDVDDYFARILPALPPGVHVHIHDIFWPFEVPGDWLDEGRAWNECHALRNFLCENDRWEITVFNDYFHWFHRDIMEAALPQQLERPGASIWLRKLR